MTYVSGSFSVTVFGSPFQKTIFQKHPKNFSPTQIPMPSTMTFVNGRMSTQQQPESCRVRYTNGPRKHTKAGHVVTFSTQKSYVSTTSKDSSDEGEEEYFNNIRRTTRSNGEEDEDGGSRQNFDVIKTLHEGKFSKILLAKLDGPGMSKERMVLKAVEIQSASSVHMFYREMDYNYLLSPHENVLTSFNVVLRWKNYYIFAQEYAPAGDLGQYLKKFGGLSETKTKSVARQIASALDFIHSLNLVHQAVHLQNILVFNRECTLIKLTDFCGMRPSSSLVMKGSFENGNEDDYGQQSSSPLLAFSPPEVCTKLPQEKYHVHPSIDVWAVGIVIWACLSGTGQGPWQSADTLRDLNFRQFYEWVKKKSLKVPDPFQPLSCRLLRLIKRLLEPKPEKRCKAREVLKYLKDDWLSSPSSKNTAAVLSKLGMPRSESCTFGSTGGGSNAAGSGGGGGGGSTSASFSRVNSQRYGRRASACPRPKSEVRKARRAESGSKESGGGGGGGSERSPRTNNKQQTGQRTSRSTTTGTGTTLSATDSFKISCVLETNRAIPLSTSKSASCIMPPPPSPTPPSSTSAAQKCP